MTIAPAHGKSDHKIPKLVQQRIKEAGGEQILFCPEYTLAVAGPCGFRSKPPPPPTTPGMQPDRKPKCRPYQPSHEWHLHRGAVTPPADHNPATQYRHENLNHPGQVIAYIFGPKLERAHAQARVNHDTINQLAATLTATNGPSSKAPNHCTVHLSPGL